jgi:hypothetical protein
MSPGFREGGDNVTCSLTSRRQCHQHFGKEERMSPLFWKGGDNVTFTQEGRRQCHLDSDKQEIVSLVL